MSISAIRSAAETLAHRYGERAVFDSHGGLWLPCGSWEAGATAFGPTGIARPIGLDEVVRGLSEVEFCLYSVLRDMNLVREEEDGWMRLVSPLRLNLEDGLREAEEIHAQLAALAKRAMSVLLDVENDIVPGLPNQRGQEEARVSAAREAAKDACEAEDSAWEAVCATRRALRESGWAS